MSQDTSVEQLLDMWEKALEEVHRTYANQADLLGACKEAAAMDATACCDTDPWLAIDIRDKMTAAIAKAEGSE